MKNLTVFSNVAKVCLRFYCGAIERFKIATFYFFCYFQSYLYAGPLVENELCRRPDFGLAERVRPPVGLRAGVLAGPEAAPLVAPVAVGVDADAAVAATDGPRLAPHAVVGVGEFVSGKE